jgi:hypothetical protein
MYLRIKVDCPLCAGEPKWIYDTGTGEKHRGAQGCPGGCTAIHQIDIWELSESEAAEYLSEERYPKKQSGSVTNPCSQTSRPVPDR